MFKNSKLLKGVVLTLALVLVLSLGVVLKFHADASSNTAVYYLSKQGDNTTGKDEATAFTSFMTACETLSKEEFAPGTKIYFLVIDQVVCDTEEFNSHQVKDTDGNVITINVTSLFDDSAEDYAEIYLSYINMNMADSSQRVIMNNSFYFKNINIFSHVHEERNSSNVRRAVNRMYFNGNDVTFDNCVIRYDDTTHTAEWFVYGTHVQDHVETAASPTITFKDGDYSLFNFCLQDTINPNYDITINLENVNGNIIYLLGDTDGGIDFKAKSLSLNVTGCYGNKPFAHIRPVSNGQYMVSDGIEVNLFNGAQVNNIKSTSAARGAHFDITYNFYPGCRVGYVAANPVELGPSGGITGNITNNFYGGTINGTVYAGGSSTGTTNATGNITNNFYGGTFVSPVYCGGHSGNYYGNITNNFYGGKFSDSVTCAGPKGNYGNVTNTYFAPSSEYAGAVFQGGVYGVGGQQGHTTAKVVTNTYNGGTFKNVLYGAGVDVRCTSVTNTYQPNTSFAGVVYGVANTPQSGADAVTNTYKGGSFLNMVYGTGLAGNYGNVSNTYYPGTNFGNQVFGSGGADPENNSTKSIQNIFYGGHFQANCFAAGRGGSSGRVTTYVYGGTWERALSCGNMSGVCDSIYSMIAGGTFIGNVLGSNTGTPTAILEIKPGESEEPLYFGALVRKMNDLSTIFYGSEKVVGIGQKTAIYATGTAGSGNVTFQQKDCWETPDDHVKGYYLQFPAGTDVSQIKTSNASASVTGSAVWQDTAQGRELVGSDVVRYAMRPTVYGTSFVLEEDIQVRFFVEKALVEDYIRENGSWSYAVQYKDQVITKTFHSVEELSQATVEGEYIVFALESGVTVADYDEKITVTLTGEEALVTSVNEILDRGISHYQEEDPEVAAMLKSIQICGQNAAVR